MATSIESPLPIDAARGDAPCRPARRVLVFSSTFPSAVQPIHGVFVKERVRSVAGLPDREVRVVSPVPYFPPIRVFKRWYPLSQIPREEVVDGLEVVRPRYFLLPKVGRYFHPASMARAAYRSVSRLDREFGFDLIDAHFVYPDGVAAARLAARLGKPLVLTGRGEDILRFPQLPVLGRQIRGALAQATSLVALSDEIAEAMRACGAPAEKIHVIPNGVDCEKFRPLDRSEARRRLGLPEDRPVVLSVGYRLERKGFHVLVDAVAEIRRRHPDVLVVIVGGQARWGQDYSSVIEERIRVNGVSEHVRLIGPRPPEELPWWYGAADLFALLTNREGSPNVVLEALACGLPVVATPIGGIPEVLSDERLGLLLGERSAGAAASAVIEALSRSWDSAVIRQEAERRSWRATSEQVRDVFDRAVNPTSTR